MTSANQTYPSGLVYRERHHLVLTDLGDDDVPCDYDDCEKQAEFIAGCRVARWVLGVYVCPQHADHWDQWAARNDGKARIVRPTPIVGRRHPGAADRG